MLDPVMWILYGIVLYISFFLIITLLDKGRVKPESQIIDDLPTLSLIIPAYNEEETIEMSIKSALAVDYPKDKYDIIVVNDGSNDSTLERIREFEENPLISIIDKDNGGKGSALNEGLEQSNAEIVACVDADSRLEEDSLKHMVSEMDEGYQGVASAMKVHNPKNMLQKIQWVEYIVGIFTRNIMGLMDAIHVTPGPLSAYKREKLLEVGKFDEESLVEDQEICFRLQEKHYRIGHSSHAEVHTVAPATISEFKNQRYRWYRGSLETIIQYKKMLFNREYGDFGVFAIPSKLAQTVLSLFVLFITLYLIGVPLMEFAAQFSRLGFDYFASEVLTINSVLISIYWSLISIRFVTLFFISALFGISLLMAYMASKHADESLFRYGYIPVVAYLAFFVFINGILWLFVIIKMIMGSDRTW